MNDGWTTETYAVHNEALRVAEERFQVERDRRHTELRQADQRALDIKAKGDEEARRIKEQGDEKALVLAREIQTYKDMIHNGTLDQLKDERGTYATKTELAAAVEKVEALIKPVVVYVESQRGSGSGRREMYAWIVGGIILLLALYAAFRPHVVGCLLLR